MTPSRLLAPVLVLASGLASSHAAEEVPRTSTLTVHAAPIHAGRVNPHLFGNFIELLNDVAPSMWAEMLQDRSFEGVRPLNNRNYFDGTPDLCDRTWDANDSWTRETEPPFNGIRGSAKLTAPASLTQSGLAVKKGLTYHFTGLFRTDNPELTATVSLKSLLPDGTWMVLGSAELHPFTQDIRKLGGTLVSRGETDRAVFEIKVTGAGHLWAYKLSLMPTDNVKGWRRDVVDAVKELHPPVIRWGGSIIDPGAYSWKEGVGDRDHRTPFVNKAWGRLDSNDVGIDEFCQFCEAVGAEPLICVSLADGAQNAADLVHYCNDIAEVKPPPNWGWQRENHGHSAPYNVKYWQVGNEIKGDRPDYLAQLGDFIRLIKEACPQAILMSSYPAPALLERFGKDLSFICPHQYTRDLEHSDHSLSELTHLIESTPGCSHLQIGITEWNVSGGDWGLMRGRQMTLETALFNARHLNIMMRHCDRVTLATRSNMANSFCGATFETNPAGLLKRPSHFTMELYTRHARPVPLKIEAEAKGPDVFACSSEDLRSVTLFAVNTALEPVQWSVSFQGFPQPMHIASAEVMGDSRDARQIDLMNHWTVPDRVRILKLPIAASATTLTLPALSATAVECLAK